MIKISVSVLDAFNKYINEHLKRSGDLIYESAEDFIAYLKRDFVKTVDMEYGSAVDAIIENPRRFFNKAVGEYIWKGIAIPKTYIEQLTPYFDYNFPFQITADGIFTIDDIEVQLKGRCDQLHGLETVEFKTCWTGYSYERYANSVQWKCYNTLLGTNRVRYVVADSKRLSGGAVSLKQVYEFYFDKKDEHTEEVKYLLTELVRFLKHHNEIKTLEVA